MEEIRFKQDDAIAQKGEAVNYWYLIQEGSVTQKFENSTLKFGKNAIIGIMEKDNYLCDYFADEDTVVAVFPCRTNKEIKELLVKHEQIRNIFLRSVIEQRHRMLSLYSELKNKSVQFHRFVEFLYNDYRNFSIKYKVPMETFSRMSHFNYPDMQHKAEQWELENSISIVKKHLQEYLTLMKKDDALTFGVIMEAGAQMRRFAQGIEELDLYLMYNKDILLSENTNDIMGLLFDMSIKVHEKKYDIEPIKNDIMLIINMGEKLGIYNSRMLTRRLNEFKNYDFNAANKGAEGGQEIKIREMDILETDCMSHILEYAGYNDVEVESKVQMITQFRELPDRNSSDKEVYALRKNITAQFYEIYQRVFMRAVKDEASLTPVLEMFLNFGFMDVDLVGEENAVALYDLIAHIDICLSKRVYTIFEWLKAVYEGKKEPSKNEFDMDYKAYLADQKKTGKINAEQLDEYLNDRDHMVAFEIQNMFPSVNKMTFGNISSFCAVLGDHAMLSSVDKMLVTAERLENALNSIRKVDYSIFYRDVLFSDVENGINSERIKFEVKPDIILMPNAGTRGMIWQESSGSRSTGPARFMFPIFSMTDVDEMMLSVMGAFRWDICRKENGMHWNDIRDKNLTAEYCSYMQFYKKNNDLSSESKEKIKSALSKAKNNYRNVFIRDYANLIIFESKGSFRLNKVSRDILVRYCPFPKEIRDTLRPNPVYQQAIVRFENLTAKSESRCRALYDRYSKAGGEQTEVLRKNLLFYQM